MLTQAFHKKNRVHEERKIMVVHVTSIITRYSVVVVLHLYSYLLATIIIFILKNKQNEYLKNNLVYSVLRTASQTAVYY